ncbi:MAG: alpha/beta hydrolase [Marmoricola sp.]|nr:alpha/beta hydrolase [Marmoricola sp.]
MTTFVRRVLALTGVVASSYAVRVIARLRPQRWLTPAISLRLFRMSWGPSLAIVAAEMRQHLPASGWSTRTDLQYAVGAGREGRFDLVLPAGPGPHPLVVWVHGGGWHFGDKSDALPYVELLATRGFAGAVLNYPRAPRARYPAAPRQVNAALRHLTVRAAEYDIDPDRIVLAGDSAGAQIAAEIAALVTNPAYAGTTTLVPALEPHQLRGALLFCGIFDPAGLVESDRIFEAALESAMWSLARSRTWLESETCRLMRVVDHLTPSYPPTFLAAGNADPLTRRQTPPMAARLRELGVSLDEYYPGDAANPINHEFQQALDTAEGQEAFERAVAFLERVTGERPSISH